MARRIKVDSITRRLLVDFVLVALIPALLISGASLLLGYRSRQTHELELLDSVATLKSAEIDMWTSNLTTDLDMLLAIHQADDSATTMLLGSVPPSEAPALIALLRSGLKAAVARSRLFQDLCVIDARGRIIVSTDPSLENQDVSGTTYYRQGLQKRFLSPPFRELQGDRGFAIVVSSPIVKPGRGAIGVLAGFSDLSELERIMQDPASMGRTGESYLVGADSSPITRTRFPTIAASRPLRSSGIRDALESNVGGRGIYRNYNAVPVVGVHRWLPTLQAALMVEQSQAEAMEPIAMTLVINLIVTLAAVLLTVFVAFGVTRSIAAPLIALSATATRIAAGDLDQTAVVKRTDEIGRLATAFNLMTGQLRGMIVRLRADLDDRTRAEGALRESEERHRSVLHLAMDGFWRVDIDARLLEVNDAYCRMSGYSEQELLSMRISDLETGETPDDVSAHVRKIVGQGYDRFESRHRRRDGSLFDVETSAQYQPIGGGEMFAFLRDISARRKDEEEREKLQARLRQSEKMESVGRLAGGVAHDFNNMLGVILGRTELALQGVDERLPLHQDLLEIRRAAERSAALTRQLLAFARKQPVAPRTLDLNATVAGMMNMLRRLIGEDIDLAWLPGAGLWPVRIDPSQIDQILANLCVNARDAISGVGKVTIETGNADLGEAFTAEHAGLTAGQYVLLAVSDTGCGMDKETLARLFEPYFTTKGTGKGTGLGLATVFGIVHQNNGYITVTSEPGLGTAFRIYLPRSQGATERRYENVVTEQTWRGNETILLVEDEPAILEMARVMLAAHGYTVLVAATPAEAIERAQAYRGEIQLLMTDVIMPGMTGRDLARELTARFPAVKCLFMSGYPADAIAHHGVLDPDVNFIQKPFTIRELTARVRDALRR